MNVLTSFPFTFKLTIPGLSNPFTSLSSTSPTTGSNPPRLPPLSGPAPPQPDFSPERPSRSLARPTRPLPISMGQNAMITSNNLRPPQRGSFSPSPTPSTSVSLAHSYSHLAPKLHLSPYEEWLLTQSRVGPPTQSHSPSPAPVSRKRGWEPSFSSPSGSETTLACSSGYLAKPAKYRELAERMDLVDVDRDGVRELDGDDLPPAKRRRGLAGSIVSTAWNAALLGTAVGLSVYRLWKGNVPTHALQQDDGPRARKRRIVSSASDGMSIEPEEYPEPPSPPPPYTSNHEWTSIDYPRVVQTTPRRDKGKNRASGVTPWSSRKSGARTTQPRRVEPRHHHTRAAPLPRGGSFRPPANDAFDFNFDNNTAISSNTTAYDASPTSDVDEQMDWIGGKLTQLIEEGKKALGTEVVVMSEAQEDEVDDGSGAWVSDEEAESGRRRSGSVRRRGSTASRYNPASLGRKSAAPSHPTTPQKPTQTRPTLSPFDGAGDEGSESPEIREMMERARAKFTGRTGTL